MYKYLFGPVPSRRLGMSLGVDLIPHKVCSFDCVYCECGATTKHTTKRMEYIPSQKVIEELKDYFQTKPDPDYITFSGAGEPSLNSGFGKVLEFIKAQKPNVPIAVLTNGSFLPDEKVRKEMLNADLVLPSLDAAVEKDFLRIDRPAENIDLKKYIQGLIDFRNEFKGKIFLEVFVLKGINDSKENLHAIKKAIHKIKPDKVQINTLDRPGTEDNLTPISKEELEEILELFDYPDTEIIASPKQRQDSKVYSDDVESAILNTIVRRPCTLDDLSNFLGLHINEVNKYLSVLEEKNKIIASRQERGIFYKLVK